MVEKSVGVRGRRPGWDWCLWDRSVSTGPNKSSDLIEHLLYARHSASHFP